MKLKTKLTKCEPAIFQLTEDVDLQCCPKVTVEKSINKMHIVFLQPNFRAAGVEKVNILLANEMHKQGHDVSFMVFKKQGEFLRLLNPSIEVININVSRALFSFPSLLALLLKSKACVISPYISLSTLAVFAKAFTFSKASIIVCEHSTLSRITNVKGSWKDRLLVKLSRFVYRRADGVVAVSQGVADDLVMLTGIDSSRIQVLYNPVIYDDLLEKATEIPSHKWLISRELPVFMGAGRLDVAKNFPLLISAFAQVVRVKDARLLILGEGSLRTQLEKQINQLGLQEKCDLVGFVDNPYSYMAHADVFVLSSDFEGLPTVVIEALACNTPVVSTDCPSGASDILENGKWGRLVPVGDQKALAQAMLDSLSEKRDIDLSLRASDFRVEKSTDKWVQFLDRYTVTK